MDTTKFLCFLFVLFISFTSAFSQSGVIRRMTETTYQLEYPTQVVNVFFNVAPDADEFEMYGKTITNNERIEILQKLDEAISLLPDEMKSKFVDVKIYFLRIRGNVAGFHIGNDIVIDLDSESERSLNDITDVFYHELAHHVMHKMKYRYETELLINDLKEFRSLYKPSSGASQTDLLQKGFVSDYAAFGGGEGYSAREDFAETFMWMLMQDDSKMKQLYGQQEYALLNEKINLVLSYLNAINPTMHAWLRESHQSRKESFMAYSSVSQSSVLDISKEMEKLESIDSKQFVEEEEHKATYTSNDEITMSKQESTQSANEQQNTDKPEKVKRKRDKKGLFFDFLIVGGIIAAKYYFGVL